MFKDIVKGDLEPQDRINLIRVRISDALFDKHFLPWEAERSLHATIGEGTSVLPDREFEDIANKGAVSPTTELGQYLLKKHSGEILAFNLPGFVLEKGVSQVYLRESFVYGDARDNNDLLTRVLLEEYAHAFSNTSAKVPLMNIQDGSLTLAPYRTKTLFLEGQRKSRKMVYSLDTPLDPDSVAVQTTGFTSAYYESVSGQERLLPAPTIQAALEESRAIIVQTMFASKLRGAMQNPQGTLSEQLHVGLRDTTFSQRSQYRGQEFGILFLSGYFNNLGSPSKEAQELMDRLYQPKPDAWVEFLARTRRRSFDDFVKVVHAFEEQL